MKEKLIDSWFYIDSRKGPQGWGVNVVNNGHTVRISDVPSRKAAQAIAETALVILKLEKSDD